MFLPSRIYSIIVLNILRVGNLFKSLQPEKQQSAQTASDRVFICTNHKALFLILKVFHPEERLDAAVSQALLA